MSSLTAAIILIFGIKLVFSDESQYFINGKKAINSVDDRFISISIDPLILFSGIDFSQSTSKLVEHVKPAYLRIAGSSTEFLQFVQDDRHAINFITDDTKSLDFGPSQWWALNQWIQNHKLTPIFAINELATDANQLDEAGLLPLLNMTSKMNIDCYWQLGYDCSGKTELQYKSDLKKARELIDKEFHDTHKWKLVGSDINKCFDVEKIPDVFAQFNDFNDADILFWNPRSRYNDYPSQDFNFYRNFVSYPKRPSIWTVAKKTESSLDFDNGILWARTIGDTAAQGFSVIFRELKLSELFIETPSFWITVLHKHLMGNNVLEVKRTSLLSDETHVYAHCSRNQDNYSVRGAVTIMVVNNKTNEHKILMRVAGTQMKNVEVRSYTLTSPSEKPTETFLNGEKLSINNLTLNEDFFTPKLRRAKASTHLTLVSTPKSVTFFVLPSARLPICVTNELETGFIYEEIQKVQSLNFPDQKSIEISSRFGNTFPKNTLNSVYKMMKNELKEAEKYYKKNIFTKPKTITEHFLGNKHDKSSFLDKPTFKQSTFSDNNKNLKNNFHESLKQLLHREQNLPKNELELTSDEVLKILSDRARTNVERKVGLLDSGLESLLENSFFNKLRIKRDINMKLLNKKINEKGKNSIFNVEKQATLRRSGESSFEDFELPIEKSSPSEIFAGFASDKESEEKGLPGLPMKPSKEKIFTSGLLNFPDLSKGLSSLTNLQPKKDLFSLEPQSKLSFGGLSSFSLFKTTSATTVKPSNRRNFLKYIEEDADDLFDDIDVNDDSLKKFHGFEETFGDDISVVNSNPYDNLKNKLGLGNSGSKLFENEFIINKNEDQDEVDKTIRRLEDFLNKDDIEPDSDKDLDSYLGRFKRRVDGFSKMNLNDNYPKSKLKSLINKNLGILGKNFRKKRTALFEIKSVENSIDNGSDENKIEFIKPSIDYKSGEYSIVLPGKSKISLVFSDADADTTITEKSDTTCATTEDVTYSTVDLDSTTISEETSNEESTGFDENTVFSIGKTDNYNLTFFKKFMKVINDFVTKMYKNINSLLKS